MSCFSLCPVGVLSLVEDRFFVRIDLPYLRGLSGLRGFSHVNVLWCFHKAIGDELRPEDMVISYNPYRNGPEEVGAFATRSPYRPNPIALTTSAILSIDEEKGLVELDYIDGDQGSPVFDLKPYTPSLDLVSNPRVPDWCSHWPKNREDSASFDWESEIR